ncbi:unnamed protein product, partial [Prorocentrum cordatum]
MAAAGHAVEITSKAMSAVLHTAAAARLDMEGLLFGHVGEGCVVVQSFQLTGPRWSACDAAGKADLAVLGWCSIRRCGQASSSPEDRSLRPTLRERCSQRGLQRHFRSGPPGSSAAVGGPPPWIALVLLQGPQAPHASECAPALRLDTFCARGPALEPVDLRIRSVGSTGGLGGGDRQTQPPPLLGPMRQAAEAQLLTPMNGVAALVEHFAKQAPGALRRRLSAAGRRGRRTARGAARGLSCGTRTRRAPRRGAPAARRTSRR